MPLTRAGMPARVWGALSGERSQRGCQRAPSEGDTVRRSTLKRLSTAVTAALVTGLLVVAPTSAGAAAADPVVFDDMELGIPLANGWFAFNGSVGGGGIDANSTDLPPVDGGALSLQTGWGSGETPASTADSVGRSSTDTSGTDHFNFWINPDAGQGYTPRVQPPRTMTATRRCR